MEKNLKTLKVEYLNNNLSDHIQILNLSWWDQIKMQTGLK